MILILPQSMRIVIILKISRYRCTDYSGAIVTKVSPDQFLALLGLLDKMYSKIQCCWQGSGKNHKDTKKEKESQFFLLLTRA